MQHCEGFISAEIKPARCCIKLVFHLTYIMMHGSTKLKLVIVFYITYCKVMTDQIFECGLCELYGLCKFRVNKRISFRHSHFLFFSTLHVSIGSR